MKRRFTPLALLAVLCSGAAFAETPDPWKDFYVKGGFASPQADARDMTTKSKGFTFEAGYVLTPAAWSGAEARFYLGYVKLGGDKNFAPWVRGEGPAGVFTMPYATYMAMDSTERADYSIKERKFSYDLTGHTFGVDFAFPFKAFNQDFTVFTGPSLHLWYVNRVNPKENIMERNLKTGWRLGGSYRYDTHLEFSATYTVTEWRSVGGNEPYEQGANPSRPAYLSLTAAYRF